VDEANPMRGDEMFNCNGCGRQIAKFGDLKAAMIKAGKDGMEKEVSRAFGKPVKLDWKSKDDGQNPD
jgi:hypothetical protein